MSDATESDRLLQEIKADHPVMIDLSLERIVRLLDDLGRPQDQLAPVVHVAGTNGKGSTIAFAAAILRAAGLKVHTYTSPHLVRFHERIGLASATGATRPIGERELCALLTRVRDRNGGRPMTFFEITTAAALLAFAETPANVLLLEVGLGGRLDATNVIANPALTAITPVSLDHQDKLGETVGEIAAEKAGILKPKVPCVVGPQGTEARQVIGSIAARREVPLRVWGEDFEAFLQNGRLIYQDDDGLLDLPLPTLRGRHQHENAGVAIASVKYLASRLGSARSLLLSEAAISEGLVRAEWPARMMPLTSGPIRDLLHEGDELWLDGGHNPAAGGALAQTIADLEDATPKPTVLICGMLANKDAHGFLAPLAGLIRAVVTVPVTTDAGSGMPRELLETAAREVGLMAERADDLRSAIEFVRETYPGPTRLVIAGSLYLAGEALALQESGALL